MHINLIFFSKKYLEKKNLVFNSTFMKKLLFCKKKRILLTHCLFKNNLFLRNAYIFTPLHLKNIKKNNKAFILSPSYVKT